MTGFPGETEEDLAELSDFVREMHFERLGCFAYSIEENTPAANMKDQLDEETKRHRQNIIMEQQSMMMVQTNRRFIGKKLSLLCEGYDRPTQCYYGRTYADAPEVDSKVYFITEGGEKPKIGEVVKVVITDSLEYDLMGVLQSK